MLIFLFRDDVGIDDNDRTDKFDYTIDYTIDYDHDHRSRSK